MKLYETLRLIWINILENKTKTMLTSLGIIVGSATIILVIAIGKGGEAVVKKQFENLSAATIYINPDYSKVQGMINVEFPKLTQDNIESILYDCTLITDMALMQDGYINITFTDKEEYGTVIGVTSNLFSISNLPVIEGELFGEIEEENSEKVAVIGDEIATKYFSSPQDAVGSKILIKDKYFIVIGVLERKGDGIQGINPDSSVFIPYSTGEKFIFHENSTPRAIGMASGVKNVGLALEEVRSALDYIVDDGILLKVSDAGSRIEAATKSSKTMTSLLISVSIIVFIVGGIGIMNVLLVSVKERTKEIGVRKALGSSRREIMLSFLLEAAGISLFGGITGAILSTGLMPLLKYTDLEVLPSVMGGVIAVIFAVVTGTVFGIYPAYEASKLNPIEALNQE